MATATFVSTAAAATLRAAGAAKVFLYITHGIFSKGFAPLKGPLDGIVTTNSFFSENMVPDEFKDFVKVADVMRFI